MKQNVIYLDFAATTPVDPEVLRQITHIAEQYTGNSSSVSHPLGWQARGVLLAARQSLAKSLGAKPEELVFTSGATESNNWVLQRICSNKGHFISCATEHKSILEPLNYLQNLGHEVTFLPVSETGRINPQDLVNALKPNTALVSLMMVNNETGIINDIKQLAELTHQHSAALFHTDATQALGKIPVSFTELGVDFLSGSAHKFHGPKGMGIMLLKDPETNRLPPLLLGGGHESGLRAGTINLPSAHGTAIALELNTRNLSAHLTLLQSLHDLFMELIFKETGLNIFLNGDLSCKSPYIINLSIPGIPSATLLSKLDRFALSSGSACTTGSGQGSHVIKAMKADKQFAECSIRISMSHTTTPEEMKQLANDLLNAIAELRDQGFRQSI